jgi:hypothetical protein
MTLFQVEELTSYWAEHPPLHLLFAAYLGVGNERRARLPQVSMPRGQHQSSDVGSMVAHLGPGFSTGDVHAGLPPVVLNFGELHQRVTGPD